MKFNVLSEPWIPVRRMNGDIEKVGLLVLLEHASDYLEIADAEAMYEFGMYRFAVLFLLDCLRPKRLSSIEKLLDSDGFDMDAVHEYVRLCESEGVSFDIYDEERPFLQSPLSQWPENTKPNTIAKLNAAMPAGNNHVHFVHKFQNSATLTSDEVAKGLVSINLFCTAGVQDYPSTVAGAPPVYCVINGKNLFETLVLNLVPMNQYENVDSPAVYWRNKDEIEPKRKVAETSLLYGMMFPCRKILIKPNDEDIREMFFCQGMDFNGYTIFKDPSVSYKPETGSNVKPNSDKEIWRNIGTIFNWFNKTAPVVVQQFHELREDTSISVRTYEVVTNQASYVDSKVSGIDLPSSIFGSQIKFSALVSAVEYVENAYRNLSNWMEALRKEITSGGKSTSLISERDIISSEYFQEVKYRFLIDFIPRLSDSNSIDKVVKDWEDYVWKVSVSCFERYGRRIGDSMKVINAVEHYKSMMYSKHYKESKE